MNVRTRIATFLAAALLVAAVPATAVAGTFAATASPDATVTLLAVGDLMVHKAQLSAAYSHGVYDFVPAFKAVAARIPAADIAAGNFETTLRTSGFTGYPCFRSPTAFARALKSAGFDVLTTANNHTLDGGATGVRYTSDYLTRIGIAHTGSNGSGATYVQHDGVKIAFLAFTYGTNGIRSPFPAAVNRLDMGAVKRTIAKARLKADLVIVVPHFGSEYVRTPEAATKAKARAMIDAGADLVLGSHPHVVRPVEKYKGHYIVYSMGNFISAMTNTYTDLGIMVSATVARRGGLTKVASLKVLPVYRDVSYGRGASTWRTVLISYALKPGASLITSHDRTHMRFYKTYCERVFKGYL
jgi:poly-gamma-glutamate capsule biosynthesis protein CapA/YwtB (metallophosphatase superfamily)